MQAHSRRRSQLVPLVMASLFVWAGLLVPSASADPTKVGGEILVSDGVTSGQTPRVAVDPGGSFVVGWQEGDYVRAHAFWANGNEQGPIFLMSDPSFDVDDSWDFDELLELEADAAGNVVVAYNGYRQPDCWLVCIVTKRRDADGKLSPSSFIVGDPHLFPPYPNDPYSYNQTANPAIAVDGQGAFVVAWEGLETFDYGYGTYSGSEAVWARKLVNSGQSNGSQFLVNEKPQAYQGDRGQIDVAADGEGDFVVVWHDENDYVPPYGGVVFRRFDKSKNPLGVQTQVDEDGGDPKVSRLPDGSFLVVWEDGGIWVRAYDSAGVPSGPKLEISPAGDRPEVAASDAGYVVVWENAGSAWGRTIDATGATTSAVFEINTSPSAGRPHVGAAASGDFVATFLRSGQVYAQRFQATAPTPLEIPVLGKVAVLTNKLPDDFEKSKGTWKASGDEIVVPFRGSADDPRCNGDPVGTVKARARFLSTSSGEDVTIDLPCQNWSTTGGNQPKAVAKRGFKYSDGKREDGPCNAVKIKGTKSLTVSCKGKPGAASFDYDLQSGVSQGALTTVLEIGQFEYCAEFQPFFDGSDGKKYKGKSLAAPASCPS